MDRRDFILEHGGLQFHVERPTTKNETMTATIRNIPPMLAVRSQSIDEIGHDGDNLYVRFKHGSLYRYAGVGQAAYNELRKAESVGKHLQVHILRNHTGVVVPEKE